MKASRMFRTMLAVSSFFLTSPTWAQDTATTQVASAKDISAQVSAMFDAMKPAQTFMWQPLLKDGAQTVALEIWKAPGRPAIHASEIEYFTVVQGSGTLVSGGHMVNPKTVRPGFIDGDSIEGGATSTLAAGDVVMIPAGVPHWFGISGEPLVLLGTKIPATPAP